MRTVMLIGPKMSGQTAEAGDAVVVALKTRSEPLATVTAKLLFVQRRQEARLRSPEQLTELDEHFDLRGAKAPPS